MEHFYSYKGKINRRVYLFRMLILGFISFVTNYYIQNSNRLNYEYIMTRPLDQVVDFPLFILCVVWILVLFLTLFQVSKRLRDIGYNPLLCLFTFIPVINIIIGVSLLFFKGKEKNEFTKEFLEQDIKNVPVSSSIVENSKQNLIIKPANDCCQAKGCTSFIFNLDLTSFADLSLVDVKAVEIIKDTHRLVKETLMKHVEFLQKNHGDKVASDKDFVACSCLELGALYWYFVVSDFSQKQIEHSVGQCFFVPFFFNFEKFEDKLNSMGYGGLLDFFGQRATSIQINLDELKGLSFERYWDYIMVFHPLIKMDGKFTGITEVVCGIDSMMASSVYYHSLIAAISDQSLKLTDRLIKRR